jgi:hypothetical protein
VDLIAGVAESATRVRSPRVREAARLPRALVRRPIPGVIGIGARARAEVAASTGAVESASRKARSSS